MVVATIRFEQRQETHATSKLRPPLRLCLCSPAPSLHNGYLSSGCRETHNTDAGKRSGNIWEGRISEGLKQYRRSYERLVDGALMTQPTSQSFLVLCSLEHLVNPDILISFTAKREIPPALRSRNSVATFHAYEKYRSHSLWPTGFREQEVATQVFPRDALLLRDADDIVTQGKNTHCSFTIRSRYGHALHPNPFAAFSARDIAFASAFSLNLFPQRGENSGEMRGIVSRMKIFREGFREERRRHEYGYSVQLTRRTIALAKWNAAKRFTFSPGRARILVHKLNNLPANASCLIKKSIRVFRRLPHRRPISTAILPTTIIANNNHRTVNCSVCNRKEKGHRDEI